MINVPRFMIAAPASGSGKTTFTCALLRRLTQSGKKCASFKCGPDYIDLMFHRESLGVCHSINLDLFLSDEETVRNLLAKGSHNADLSVIEGVMGYYDGLAGKSDVASSWDIARVTKTPVILLIDGRGMSVSLGAIIHGFKTFKKESMIRAVVFNHTTAAAYPALKALAEAQGMLVAGWLPDLDYVLESRHLGLITAAETRDLERKLDMLAARAQSIDIELLEKIASEAPPLEMNMQIIKEPAVRIAVAKDKAFCFYYEESLALLEEMGATLIPFSPISDDVIPKADGLLLGGGYPEIYAKELSQNTSMLNSVAKTIRNGMPTIAECGGFLYLCRKLEGLDGNIEKMTGIIDGNGYRTPRLRRFGYATLTARRNNMLCEAGESLQAHEFHYWDSSNVGDAFIATKPLRDTTWNCIHTTDTMYAGFPHLYLAGKPQVAKRFLKSAAVYQKREI